jgi:hypothetical protein
VQNLLNPVCFPHFIVDKKKTLFANLRSNLTFIILGLIALIILHTQIVKILLIIMLVTAGWYTMKISRMMPNISIETVTASAILLGYLYGWQIALAFGLIVGISGYIRVSQLMLTTIVASAFMGLCGVLGALFAKLGYAFWIAYLITYGLRAVISFPVYQTINPDLVGNIMHSFVESIFNMVVTINFMIIIYNLIKTIPFT